MNYRNTITSSAFFLALAFTATPARADNLPHLKLGAWESTWVTKMELPAGLPPAIAEQMAKRMEALTKPQTSRRCYTQGDAASDTAMLEHLESMSKGMLKCDPIVNTKTGGNVYHSETSCTANLPHGGAAAMQMKVSGTTTELDSDHYTSKIDTTTNSMMGEQHQSVSVEAKYLGTDCAQYGAQTMEEIKAKLASALSRNSLPPAH